MANLLPKKTYLKKILLKNKIVLLKYIDNKKKQTNVETKNNNNIKLKTKLKNKKNTMLYLT